MRTLLRGQGNEDLVGGRAMTHERYKRMVQDHWQANIGQLKLALLYETMARQLGFRTWHVLSAQLKAGRCTVTEEQVSAALVAVTTEAP